MDKGRQMGLAATIAVVTGESIALGIFLTPAAMARSLGSPVLLAAVWCGMGLMTMCGALCYSELAVHFPVTGGEYVYLREGFGGRIAFLFGWMSAAVMDPGLAAALAVGATPYVLALFGFSTRVQWLIPVVMLVGLAVLNYVGTNLSRRLMATANLLKIAVLVCLVAWAWISGHATVAHLMPLAQRRAGSEPIFAAIAGATVSAFFSFGGWWEAGKVAGEVRNPRRNLPLAFTCGVLLVTGVYLLVSFAFLSVVPLERIVSNTAFVAQFGEALFGATGGRVLSACVLLSVLGGLMALTMAAPRVYYAMAKDKLFFKSCGKVNRHHAPGAALIVQGIWCSVLCLSGTYNQLLDFLIFAVLIFYILTLLGLFILRWKRPEMERPYRAFGYPFLPALYLVMAIFLEIQLLRYKPQYTWPGLIIVVLGVPVYWLWKLAGKSSESGQAA